MYALNNHLFFCGMCGLFETLRRCLLPLLLLESYAVLVSEIHYFNILVALEFLTVFLFYTLFLLFYFSPSSFRNRIYSLTLLRTLLYSSYQNEQTQFFFNLKELKMIGSCLAVLPPTEYVEPGKV